MKKFTSFILKTSIYLFLFFSYRMSFNDFKTEYMKMEICYLGPDTLGDEDSGKHRRWEGTIHQGSWRKFVNAGGCVNHKKCRYPLGFYLC